MSPTQATGEARRLHGESEWVEAIRAGNASAFEAMFHRYHAPLCSFAYRYPGARHLAEEMVQEVFLCIWERRASWEVRTSVRSYLLTAVRNAALSYLRHERVVRRRETEIRDLRGAGDYPESWILSEAGARDDHHGARVAPGRRLSRRAGTRDES